jgi:hypothetical protein
VVKLVLLHGHEVGELGDPVFGVESREKNVGPGKIHLPPVDGLHLWSDRESTSLGGIEQGGEDRRRVELGKAHEIDRPVLADERDGMEVADDAVVLDRLILLRLAHRDRSSFPAERFRISSSFLTSRAPP